jgi:hypothetical protein
MTSKCTSAKPCVTRVRRTRNDTLRRFLVSVADRIGNRPAARYGGDAIPYAHERERCCLLSMSDER